MISKIKKYNQKISIQIKVVIGIILFTVLILVADRYEMSKNIVNQFLEAKQSKNMLLVNTISPILSLNISLGLEDANKDYLDQIVMQNPYIIFIELTDIDGQVVYKNHNNELKHIDTNSEIKYIDFYNENLIDEQTNNIIGSIHLRFSKKDFYQLKYKNKISTLKILLITSILLVIFVIMIGREFRPLRELSKSVLAYDPKLNNLILPTLSRVDEVGIIHNAIKLMVDKINMYTYMLDEINLSLEDKVKERTKELRIANEQLEILATIDELTQLANRRHFEEYFQKNWEFAKRKRVNITLVMSDIDYFKNVNDTYGHQIGDEVLKTVAKALKKSLKRKTDFVARYGGEEFIMVLYETNLDEARILCQRVQENLKIAQNIISKGIKIDPVTMSFGISCTVPAEDVNSETLIKDADNALYKAKDNGRNCIVG